MKIAINIISSRISINNPITKIKIEKQFISKIGITIRYTIFFIWFHTIYPTR